MGWLGPPQLPRFLWPWWYIINEPASLARATRVVIYFIFALGPSALDVGKVTSVNFSLGTLVIKVNICFNSYIYIVEVILLLMCNYYLGPNLVIFRRFTRMRWQNFQLHTTVDIGYSDNAGGIDITAKLSL